ncbi:MAG: hypothetical protein COB08_013865 [Rhodobacteraceae bacterium]|nr:hypothetical protein [Paracoccaceae bacterium]
MALGKISRQLARLRDRKVKIFGERNTGTRAVVRMLRAQKGVSPGAPGYKKHDLDALENRINEKLEGFHHELFSDALDDIRRSRLGGHSAWKHAAPIVDESYAAKKASVLFLVRDPYSWIAALYRNPYHARAPLPDSLEAFLEQPWLTVRRENIAPILMSPMELWNAKLRAYHAFAAAAPVPSSVLCFEEFVLNPVEALGAALTGFGISAKGLEEAAEPTKKQGIARDARMHYYKAKAWEQEISPQTAALINTYADWDVAAHFGYLRRDPAEFSADK